jgi:cytochrome oxidase Cu insertion factor (SCO1/SenC/PrrC family)
MKSGLNLDNPLLAAAFRSALLHQGMVALLVFGVLALAWVSIREWRPASAAPAGTPGSAAAAGTPGSAATAGTPGSAASASGWRRGSARGQAAEPAWRMLLRVGFGLIWIFDGLLQAQPSMVVGLPSRVIQPGAASSPAWVQHLVNWAGTSWSYHPVQAAAATVWIQVGIGCWMLAARRGRWSRLAGLAGLGWGLTVWVFGEAFGGIFAPGLTWLFGAPGAAVFYCVAGGMIALPERYWRAPWLGRAVLTAAGLFFAGMAVLQAWPGRGYWQGRLPGGPGTLTGMIQSMAQTPQPHLLASLVRGFASFTAGHGFAVNLFAVVALALIGAALLTGVALMTSAGPMTSGAGRAGPMTSGAGRSGPAAQGAGLRLIRVAVIVAALLCLADWVLIEDLGIFGGLGTDPNSMIPMSLILVAGYLALGPAPARVAATEPAVVAAGDADPAAPGGRKRLSPGRLAAAFSSADARTVAAAWALGLTVLGAFPLAAAAANRTADPVIAQAIDGSAGVLNFPAPGFRLTDQDGTPVSLASLHGKVVLLTFLDPVCTTDCPLIAQEFRAADQMLGANRRNVELVAIAANPVYHSVVDTQAFDQQEGLSRVPNWKFLSGPLPELRRVWHDYFFSANITPAGGMVLHSDVAYVIDAAGRTRTELNFDPGPGTAVSKSSFAAELTGAATKAMKS